MAFRVEQTESRPTAASSSLPANIWDEIYPLPKKPPVVAKAAQADKAQESPAQSQRQAEAPDRGAEAIRKEHEAKRIAGMTSTDRVAPNFFDFSSNCPLYDLTSAQSVMGGAEPAVRNYQMPESERDMDPSASYYNVEPLYTVSTHLNASTL